MLNPLLLPPRAKCLRAYIALNIQAESKRDTQERCYFHMLLFQGCNLTTPVALCPLTNPPKLLLARAYENIASRTDKLCC